MEHILPPIRVLLAKPGLDGHDRGIKIIARALRDAGMEVVYTGLRQTPAMIAETALQEDVQVIGLSILSGAHMTVFETLLKDLRRRQIIIGTDLIVLGGGIIPDKDVEDLRIMGISEIFGPGTPTTDIVEFIRKNAPKR